MTVGPSESAATNEKKIESQHTAQNAYDISSYPHDLIPFRFIFEFIFLAILFFDFVVLKFFGAANSCAMAAILLISQPNYRKHAASQRDKS